MSNSEEKKLMKFLLLVFAVLLFSCNNSKTVKADLICKPDSCTESHKTVCSNENGDAVCKCDDNYSENSAGVCENATTCSDSDADECIGVSTLKTCESGKWKEVACGGSKKCSNRKCIENSTPGLKEFDSCEPVSDFVSDLCGGKLGCHPVHKKCVKRTTTSICVSDGVRYQLNADLFEKSSLNIFGFCRLKGAALIGEKCGLNKYCVENSSCVNGICLDDCNNADKCDQDNNEMCKAVNGRGYKKFCQSVRSGVGGTCKDKKHCTGENSKCSTKKPAGYCTQTCTDHNSACMGDGVCGIQEGKAEGVCYKTCEKHSDCGRSDLKCANYKNLDKAVCVFRSAKGQSCDPASDHTCQEGLKCDAKEKICKESLEEKDECDPESELCGKDLACHPVYKQCVESCDTSSNVNGCSYDNYHYSCREIKGAGYCEPKDSSNAYEQCFDGCGKRGDDTLVCLSGKTRNLCLESCNISTYACDSDIGEICYSSSTDEKICYVLSNGKIGSRCDEDQLDFPCNGSDSVCIASDKFKNGYCSIECSASNNTCQISADGEEGLCVKPKTSQGRCMRTCEKDKDCLRDDYECKKYNNLDKNVCWPK